MRNFAPNAPGEYAHTHAAGTHLRHLAHVEGEGGRCRLLQCRGELHEHLQPVAHDAGFGELLFVTLDEIAPPSPPRGGTVEEQIHGTVLGLGRALRDGAWGSIVGSVIERAAHDPVIRRYHARFTRARRTPLVALLRRATETGLLDADVDPETVATRLVAPLYYCHLVLHRPMRNEEIRSHILVTLARP